MNERDVPQATQDWKDRYFKAIFELDEKDRRAAAREDELLRVLERVGDALVEARPDLVSPFGELRESLASGRSDASLHALIDIIAASLRAAPPTPEADFLGGLDAALAARAARSPQRVAQVRDALRRASDPVRIQNLLDECRELLAPDDAPTPEASATSVQFETAPLTRLLDNLKLNGASADAARALKVRIAEHADQLSVLRKVDELAATLSAALEIHEHALLGGAQAAQSDVAKRSLVSLLDRIAFPGDLTQRVESVKVVLDRFTTQGELDAAVSQIAEIVRLMMTRLQTEVAETARFLKDVASRLVGVRRWVDGESAERAVAHEGRRAFEAAVSDSLRGVRSGMDSAGDLAALKLLVANHLNEVDGQVRQYLEAEERRSRAADKALRDMTDQIGVLEQETALLRDSIREEHSRALRDALTGVPNRLAYEERMGYEFARWKRYGGALSLIVLDIDHFKRINDVYGHLAGDRVLKTVAAQLARQMRETDFFGRFGGEEFVMVLPSTALDDAFRAAEKLRGRVQSSRFNYRDEPVSVTVSCGVAEFHEGDAPEDVFRRADEALYVAKRQGRNCSRTEIQVLQSDEAAATG